MIEPDATLRQIMEPVYQRFGTAPVLYDLSCHLTWNARYAPLDIQADIEKAGHAVGQAASTAEWWEQLETRK